MTGKTIAGPRARAFNAASRAIALCAFIALASACSSPAERFERYMTSGQTYLDEGKLGLANVQFLNALKIENNSVPALIGLAKVAEKRANYEQMFGILQRVNRIDPENAEVRLDLAKLYLLGNDAATSLEHVNSVLEASPASADAIALKAAVMFRLQNVAEAVDLARQALEISPTSQEAISVLVGARVNAKDFEGALAILDEALARDRKAPVLHILRVQVLKDLGRTEDINAAYLALIEEFPDDANYRRLYATALIAEERFEEARAQLAETASLLPRQRDAKLDVVRMDYRIGGREKAEETLRRYIAAAEDDVELKFALGAFLREEKDFAAADRAYHDILHRKGAGIEEILRAKNELASVYLLQGKRAEAEKVISEILAADGRDPEALIKRAGIDIEAGKTDSAIGDLRVVLGEHPDSTPARLLMGAALEQKGEFAFAEKEYAQAVEAAGKGAQVSNAFAKFLLRRGEAARAEKVLADSVAVDPTFSDNLKLLAALRLDMQNWRGAEQAANALRAIDSSDDVVSRILGAAYSGMKDYAGAIDVLTKEHERAPLESRPLTTLIQAYVDAGRRSEAETFLGDIIEKNPSYYDARILLAQVQRIAGEGSAAIETLRAAAELDPLRPEAYEGMYGVYVLEGRRDDAGQAIEQAIAAIPDNDGLQMLKADHLIAIGEADGAISIYETILARRPDDLIVANNLASLLCERGDADSVARALKAAAPLKGADNPYFLDTYGWALYLGGQQAEGMAALEKAAASAPALADARYHLGVALLENGQKERGLSEMKAVIATPGARAELVAAARAKLAGD